MQIGTKPAMRVLALAMMMIALVSPAAAPAEAQSIPCTDEPLLGTFDADGDGVLTVVEVREASPDNVQIQTVADQMEAAGITGIRYTGCPKDDTSGSEDGEESPSNNEGHQDGSTTTDQGDEVEATVEADAPADGTGADESPSATAEASTPQASEPSEWFDERKRVTTLPGVGVGHAAGSFAVDWVLLGDALLLGCLALGLRAMDRAARPGRER